jgi:hypothetical protein
MKPLQSKALGSLARRACAALAAIVGATGALDEDELHCEEAVAHLSECCPDLFVENLCGSAGSLCERTVTLTRDESECITELACDEHASEVCARLEALQTNVDRPWNLEETSPAPLEWEEVCP